ncbi:MAG: rod shape-determining protein MreC [Acidobacteriota bacterium]|nr:rod shape-determining protein MreC [Acidobacteriota bacterium]
MESISSRYRNISVLLVSVFAQVVLLAIQVKNGSDVRMIRVWAVTAVTPLAQVVEESRSTVAGFFGSYVSLRDVREKNRAMQTQLDSLKLEIQYLRNELAMADRVKALSGFEARSPSKMLAARIIGSGSGAANRVSFVDRGSTAGVEKGMGVVTPDGIVGKVLASYPTASQVLMVDDPGFAAGVISQKNRVRGILKGLGHGKCHVDYVQNEESVEPGEMFYTSGDDRVFPKGMPAGKVTSVAAGASFKSIAVEPVGLQNGPEEVLIVLEGQHQPIPELAAAAQAVYLGPEVTPEKANSADPAKQQMVVPLLTDADRLRERYKEIGAAQNHKFGEGAPGSLPPDFNLKPKPVTDAPPGTKPIPAKPPAPSTAAPAGAPPPVRP